MFIIAVYCPEQQLAQIKAAMFAAGGGQLGHYDCCSFEYRGIGQFRALPGARPYVGRVEQLEQVREVKLEMVCSSDKVAQVIAALRKAHPYEEPAFHVLKDYSQEFQD